MSASSADDREANQQPTAADDKLPATREQASPAGDSTRPDRSGSASRPGPDLRLPQFPGYETESVLGEGGMGIVYRARHVRLGRPVAIKTLLAGFGPNRDAIARLLNEIDVVARLRHNHIVQIVDSGELDGRPYYVMELVDGGNLAQYLARQPPTFDEAARLARTLARAIGHAHAEGIVHRDLKPSNILFDAEGQPKIADFGIAKTGDSTRDMTATGAILGTPGYLSPEQAAGRTADVTAASDVFSLGVILYEMLTGRRPFEGNSEVEVFHRIIHDDPPSPAFFRPGVPRDLETICLKCLQKNPARRYFSATELEADLGRFLDNRPILARPASRIEQAIKWTRRHPAWATAIAFLAIALPAGLAALIWTNQRLASDLAQKNRLIATNGDLGRWIIEEHLPELDRLNGGANLQYELAVRLRDFLDNTRVESDSNLQLLRQLAAAHGGVAAVLGGRYGQHLGRVSESLDSHRRAIHYRQEVLRQEPTDENLGAVLSSQFQLVSALWHTEGLSAVEAQLGEMEPAIQTLYGRDPARNHKYLLRLRQEQYEVRLAKNDFAGAEALLKEIEALPPATPTADSDPLAATRLAIWLASKRGELASRQGDHETALLRSREVVGLSRELLAADPNSSGHRLALSGALLEQSDQESWLGHADEALQLAEEAASVRREILEADPASGDALEQLAVATERLSRLHLIRGDHPRAIETIRSSISLWERASRIDQANRSHQRNLAIAHSHLGDCLAQSGELEQATGEHETALGLILGLDTGSDTEISDLQIQAEIHFSLGSVALQRWLPEITEEAFVADVIASPVRALSEEHLQKSIATWDRITSQAVLSDSQQRMRNNAEKLLELLRGQTEQLRKIGEKEIY